MKPLATSHLPLASDKLGISLIAVLMFMLAATTASVVIFRIISSENLSSGARLKASEAWQASESGIDAVRSWLSNRAADAGSLVTAYENDESTPKKPVKIELGGVDGDQKFNAYLIGIDSRTMPLKLKVLVEGFARDGSKASQTAIFSTSGLYQVSVPGFNEKRKAKFRYAFFGSFDGNTQGKFSSAVLNAVNNGTITINGITTTGNLIATGTLSFMDNADNKIGCTDEPGEEQGDLYVTGNFNPRGFTICGNAFVGGNMTSTSKPLFMKDLFVVGTVMNPHFAVMGNMTLGGILDRGGSNDGMLVQGNLVLADVRNDVKWGSAKTTSSHGNFQVSNDLFVNGSGGNFGGGSYQKSFASFQGLAVEGNFWIDTNFIGSNSNDRANRINFATQRGSAYVPNATFVSGNAWRNNNAVNFSSYSGANPKVSAPTTQNRPDGASNLDSLAMQVEECHRPNGRVELCVPDPLELPAETKNMWHAKADTLAKMANPTVAADTTILKNISNACLRLLKENNSNQNNDNLAGWYGCGYGSQTQFTNNVNQCYADLKAYNNGKLLYGDGEEQFLAVNLKSCNGTERGQFDGKFIFIFKENVSHNIKFGETTQDAAVFIYLTQGATGTMAMTGARNDGKHRNYFIYSEKDIAGMSGSTTLSGTIFLANGAKSGQITDTDINFNEDLFQSLLDAGILGSTLEEIQPPPCDPPCEFGPTAGYPDSIWIPISSRILVKLENKEITKEKAPALANTNSLGKSILVMPRVVRLATDQLNTSNSLRKYYSYMYLNGALESDTAKGFIDCNKGFNPSGTNAPGVYICKFHETTVPHSEFYVNVAGETGDPKIWLEADRLVVSEITPCATVYAMADANDENSERVAHISIMPSNPEGWVHPIPPTIDVTIPANEGSKQAYQFCLQSGSEVSSAIIVRIETADYARPGTEDERKITITRETPSFNIFRTACTTLCNDMVICPNSGDSWLTLACSKGTTSGSMAAGWQCEGVPGQSADFSFVNIPAACEAPPSGIQSALRSNLGMKIATALSTGANASFEMDLAWKKYKVTVSGKDALVTLSTTNPGVPVSEQNIVCGGTGCDVYHGAVYSVIHQSGLATWSCSPGSACSGENYLKTTGGSETITPVSNVHITLGELTLGLTQCQLSPGKQVIKGQSLGTLSGYVESYSVSGPCGTPTFSYTANPANSNGAVGSAITITMGVTCSANNSSVTNPSVQCGGSIIVADEIAPSITCAWGKSTDYYIGDVPTVNSTVTNGNVTVCQKPTVTSTFSNLASTGSWTVAGTASSVPSNAVNYAITANSALNATASNRSVTVQTVCTGGSKNGNYTATCSGKTVGAEPPCEYLPSWCNDNPFTNVTNTWSSAGMSNGCYFVSSIDRHDGAAPITVNGQNFATTCGQWSTAACATFLTSIAKADGGYYIYQPNTLYNSGMTNGPALKAGCIVPTATCAWAGAGQTLFTGASKPADPTISCSSGSPNTPTWTNLPPATLNIATTYSPVPTGVTCGGKAIGNIVSCGILTVKQTPSINQCTGTSGQNVTLPAKPTQPTITLNDPSNVCSGSLTNITWTVSKSGSNVSNATWNNIFDAAGTYNNYSVSGKCGTYPTNLTSTCSGSATVSAAVAPVCDFNPSWCPGISWANIKTGSFTAGAAQCHFISNMSSGDGHKAHNNNSPVNWMINGETRSNCDNGCNSSGIAKADGGYYIYTPTSTGTWWTQWSNASAKRTDCTPAAAVSSSSAAASSSSKPSSSSVAPSSSSAAASTCADYHWPTWAQPPKDVCRKIISTACTGRKVYAQCGGSSCFVTVDGVVWNGGSWAEKKWDPSEVIGKEVTFSGTFNGIDCRD